MELGMMIAGGSGLTVPNMVDLAVRAEESGFDAVHVPESWRSGYVPVTAIAAATRRVRVGAYVLNAHARTPLAAGMSAVDLDQVAGGRLVLAVGSGNEVMNENGHGVPVTRPLVKMRDYVEVLRRVTSAPPGTTVTYEGDRHSIRDWRPQATLVRPSMPILLAATGPRMMETAAEVADGLALGVLQSTGFLDEVGSAAHRRSPLGEDFLVHSSAFVSADPDGDLARRRARQAIVDLFAVKPHPHYVRLLRQQGFGDFVDDLHRRLRDRGAEAALDAVPDQLVAALTIAGTPAECVAQLAGYRDVVDALNLVNVSALKQIAPGDDTAAGETEAVLSSYDALFDLATLVAEEEDA